MFSTKLKKIVCHNLHTFVVIPGSNLVHSLGNMNVRKSSWVDQGTFGRVLTQLVTAFAFYSPSFSFLSLGMLMQCLRIQEP
jgi:hypothetical protein